MTLSPDGLWWWNGKEWVSALSPDGRWRWDGERWVLNAVAAGQLAHRYVLAPTHETQPLQLAVIAYLIISAAIGIYVIPHGGADAIRSSPYFTSDSALGQTSLDSIVNAYVGIGIGAVIVWNGLLVAGAWFRWRWVYYVFMILAVFGAFGVLAGLISLAADSSSPTAPMSFINVVVGLAQIGIAVWMFRAWRDHRAAWAMQTVPVPA